MAKRRKNESPGRGNSLDLWEAPPGAGDAVGVIATSFTFQAGFFEEDCLARFVGMQSDPKDKNDDVSYLVEMEERFSKLNCALALVDRQHAYGEHSLRWDLAPVRVKNGAFHPKIAILRWENLVRVIVASANLTYSGYRQNRETINHFDYSPLIHSPAKILEEATKLIAAAFDLTGLSINSEPRRRWDDFLKTSLKATKSWSVQEAPRGNPWWAEPVFMYPASGTVAEQLLEDKSSLSWDDAWFLSPFFDEHGYTKTFKGFISDFFRKRDRTNLNLVVDGSQDPISKKNLLQVPQTIVDGLKTYDPGLEIVRVLDDPGEKEEARPLHAKMAWFETEGGKTA